MKSTLLALLIAFGNSMALDIEKIKLNALGWSTYQQGVTPMFKGLANYD